MSIFRSRLPPSFSVTVGTYPTSWNVAGHNPGVGKRHYTRTRGVLQWTAKGGESTAFVGAGQPQHRPRPWSFAEASLRPPRVSLRSLAPHRRWPPRDRSPFRGIAV